MISVVNFLFTAM